MIRQNLPDRDARNAAVLERARNVVVDAGAGTGKTAIIVARVVALVDPRTDAEPISISRIAAVTFTRRAAGELRVRIGAALTASLSDATAPSSTTRLRAALAGLDGACIGTIHSFADRLLRLEPAGAGLSAEYEITDRIDPLVLETVDVLLRGARDGSLTSLLGALGGRTEEAEGTLRDLRACDIRVADREMEHGTLWGLTGLVSGFVRNRDAPPLERAFEELDLSSFRRHSREFLALIEPLTGTAPGVTAMRRLAGKLGLLETVSEPVVLFREIAAKLARKNPFGELRKGTHFNGDPIAWDAWRAFIGDDRKVPVRARPLRADLVDPLRRWLAHRVVRMFPVIVAAYESVKRRRRVLDPLDLLLCLRNVLAMDLGARTRYQQLFDHVLVDEFQDTDPLQAEILTRLCEEGAAAGAWGGARLTPGKLTVVGDPKQSIYRFRRADIETYDTVVRQLECQGALRVSLSANLRSDPALVDFLNDRFEKILRISPDGRTFDSESGRVFHQPLLEGRERTGETPRVHAITLASNATLDARGIRRQEARALACHLRWLVNSSGITFHDPVAGKRRGVRLNDIAVLAAVTTNLGLLFPELERFGLPYSAAGGRMFLQDPLHRRFLSGLHALSDPDDGVARATLMRQPFFAIEPGDRVRAREAADCPTSDVPAVLRVREAQMLVRELRRRRFARSIGETARDLLERSDFGRAAALGPNGSRRLAGLYELCLSLDRMSRKDGLDHDGAASVVLEWIRNPIQMDPPAPVDLDAVRVLTVHQAKGLEFPVVVLWDCRSTTAARADSASWTVRRDGGAWALSLENLAYEEPIDGHLAAKECEYDQAQRERLVYVSATRARELLVLACHGDPNSGSSPATNSMLLAAASEGSVAAFPGMDMNAEPSTSDMRSSIPIVASPEDDEDLRVTWRTKANEASKPRLRQVTISAQSRVASLVSQPEKPADRQNRFGAQFGSTVHAAIGLCLRSNVSASEGVRRVAGRYRLSEHVEDAMADVGRTIDELRRQGFGAVGAEVRLEYPVFTSTTEDILLAGNVDFVASTPDGLVVLDFKTDAPPSDGVLPPSYVRQIHLYAAALRPVTRGPMRCGLLYTADARIRWA